MLVTTLRIDGETYCLPETLDISALKLEIVAAARGDAVFVDFDARGEGRVSVLIASQTPVRFETVDHTPEEVEEWEATSPSADLELEYLSYGL